MQTLAYVAATLFGAHDQRAADGVGEEHFLPTSQPRRGTFLVIGWRTASFTAASDRSLTTSIDAARRGLADGVPALSEMERRDVGPAPSG